MALEGLALEQAIEVPKLAEETAVPSVKEEAVLIAPLDLKTLIAFTPAPVALVFEIKVVLVINGLLERRLYMPPPAVVARLLKKATSISRAWLVRSLMTPPPLVA